MTLMYMTLKEMVVTFLADVINYIDEDAPESKKLN